jgi:hypothetical protein
MQILVADRRGLVTAMEHPGVLRQIAKSLVRQLQSPSEAMTPVAAPRSRPATAGTDLPVAV